MRYTNFENTMIVLTVVFFVGLGCTITPWQQSGNSGQPPPAVQTPTPDPETTRLNQKVEDLEKQLQDQAKQKNAPVVNPTVPVIKTRRGVPWANSPRDGFLALRSEPSANGGYRIAQIPHGSNITVHGCQDFTQTVSGRRGRWCRVSYGGSTGWAFDGWISY